MLTPAIFKVNEFFKSLKKKRKKRLSKKNYKKCAIFDKSSDTRFCSVPQYRSVGFLSCFLFIFWNFSLCVTKWAINHLSKPRQSRNTHVWFFVVINDHIGSQSVNATESFWFQKKTIKKDSNKNYSPTKIRSRNFLTNIYYNHLISVNFVNAWFIIDFYTYILFNLNLFFLERKFDNKSDREYIETLYNDLNPNQFYIYICRNDNFLTLNKLSLKYQNAYDIVNKLILKDNNFLWLKEYFRKNALLYQYVYSTLFPKSRWLQYKK